MNKLPNPYMKKIKSDMKNRWLAGETIKSIAQHYEVVPRNIYYHMGPLTPEEKALHTKNLSLRNMTGKFKNRKRINVIQGKEDHGGEAQNSKESEGNSSSIGLAGFK